MFDFIPEKNSRTPSTFTIEEYVSLHDKNWFATGGKARYYCRPQDGQDFAQALTFANSKGLEVFVLGSGANILISDDGFDGLVIHPENAFAEIIDSSSKQVLVRTGAGTEFSALISFCLENNLLGLEEFSGIPGTVGGSIYINIHYYEFLLEQFLVNATIINKKTGVIDTVDSSWFNFGYDQSKLQEHDYFVVEAIFKVRPATEFEAAHALGRSEEIIRHRLRRYPSKNTCGSFFRNFHPHEVAHTEKKLIYVAYYLDKLGVKGELSVGGAIVSHQHANMIVNKGTATSQDIIDLVAKMQTMVYNNFGILPEPECQLIGFKEYPLKKL